jgi:hypothetical protein
MPHEDVADGGFEQWVVGREDAAPGQAEYDLDAFHLEALDEGLGSGELHDRLLKLKRPPGWEVVGRTRESGAPK